MEGLPGPKVTRDPQEFKAQEGRKATEERWVCLASQELMGYPVLLVHLERWAKMVLMAAMEQMVYLVDLVYWGQKGQEDILECLDQKEKEENLPLLDLEQKVPRENKDCLE